MTAKVHQVTQGRVVTTTFRAEEGSVCSHCKQVIDPGERVGVTSFGAVSHWSEGVCKARARAKRKAAAAASSP